MLWLVVVRNLKQCGDQVQNDHKSAQDQLKKAEQCFELGDEGRELADTLHESAAKQLDMAAKQLSIGTEQHIQADKLAEQAVKSDDLGRKLQANAVEIEGNTQIVPRHQRSGPSSTR
jgi:Na+/phosphate symporter